MNNRWILGAASIVAVVLILGAFVDIALGADPARVTSLVVIALAATVTPMLGLIRLGSVEQQARDNGNKSDQILNGVMDAKMKAAIHAALDERENPQADPDIAPTPGD